MGRLDLLRHHIAYKTKAILDIATRMSPGSRIIMIGDNAEYDAFIYVGVRLFVERRIDLDGLRGWLSGAMVEGAVIAQVIGQELVVPDDLKVDGIYIRSVPGYAGRINSRFAGTWYEFEHWSQVAWSFIKSGIISPKALPQLVRSFHNLHGVPIAHLRWCLYQALERDDLSKELRDMSEQCLLELTNLGASGPTRRMLGWEFDLNMARDIGAIGRFDIKEDAGDWYRAIASSRLERKKNR
jgi:hypothetical protein